MNGVQIRIRGKVQGVGFRPFVWQLAQRQARCGDVCNDGEGVLVRLAGGDDGFTAALAAHCPPHALVCVDRNKLEQMNIEKRRRTALAW